MYNFLRHIVSFVFKILFFVKYENKDVIEKNDITGGCIVASNHISAVDPCFIGIPLKRHMYFMAKAEAFDIKLLAPIIKYLGAFPVHRDKIDISAVKNALKVLNSGNVLGIFPQGTRMSIEDSARIKQGAVQFAFRTGSPIVPVGIHTKNGKVRIFRRVYVKFGEPIYLDKIGVKGADTESMNSASEYLMSTIKELACD